MVHLINVRIVQKQRTELLRYKESILHLLVFSNLADAFIQSVLEWSEGVDILPKEAYRSLGFEPRNFHLPVKHP